MALTPAERAKRHRSKKIGPGATTEDRVAYKKKRSAISTKSKKKRKEEQKEMAFVSEKAKRQDAIPSITWKQAYLLKEDVVPEYKEGKVIKWPMKLHGNSALAAKILIGFHDYLQKWRNSDDMKEILKLAEDSDPKLSGIRKITGN